LPKEDMGRKEVLKKRFIEKISFCETEFFFPIPNRLEKGEIL